MSSGSCRHQEDTQSQSFPDMYRETVDSMEEGKISSTALFSGSSDTHWLSGKRDPLVSLGTLFWTVYLPS